jgi:hypothetical protein
MSRTLRGLIETQVASEGVELVTVPGRGEGIFGKRYAAGLAAALRKAIQTPTPPTRREPRE